SSVSSMNERGSRVSGLSVGRRSHAAMPRSCCSAARHTSSCGSSAPKRAFPQARASWPETHAWAGCPTAISWSPSRHRSIAGVSPPRGEALRRRLRSLFALGLGVLVGEAAIAREQLADLLQCVCVVRANACPWFVLVAHVQGRYASTARRSSELSGDV